MSFLVTATQRWAPCTLIIVRFKREHSFHFRFFLLIMLITHSPSAAYFSHLCLYLRFLAPLPLIIIFSLSTLFVRSIFTRLLILIRLIHFLAVFWKKFVSTQFVSCYFLSFFLLIIYVISSFSRTITVIIIYSTLQQFTVLGLRQNFNFKSRCVQTPAQDQLSSPISCIAVSVSITIIIFTSLTNRDKSL